LEGLTLYKLEGNTRTKNNPDFVTLLMDGFRQLNSSLDDEAKDFTVDAFNYLVMKDGLQFKNNSFIRQIEPYFLSRMTSSLDIVQDLLSNDKTIHSFRSVFGVKTQDEVMNNFVTLFTSDRNNNFGFKYLNSPDVSKNMKANVVKSLNSPEELAKMTKEEKNEQIKDVERADLEKNAPLFFTADKNGTRIMKIDLSAGVEGDESRKEKSRLWTANKSSLLSFKGMFEYREDGIALPLVFIYNNILGNGIKFKNYYKLVSYTVKVDGKDVTYKADNFNGKDMHEGYYAIYEEFKPWGSQETSVYPFSPKEWESFSAGRELEIAKAKEESKKLEIPEKKTILSNPIEKQKNEIYDFLNSEKASIISPEQKKDIIEALKNAKTGEEISEIIQTKIC